ncbi:MAG TPA: PKD domain-containing protein [Chitinophagales bacterium]|nr:PKD domain-containing protein [Chitinophagales bacterium]
MRHFPKLFPFLPLLFFFTSIKAQLPADFVDQLVAGGLDQVMGIKFDTTGRMWEWEKRGVVKIFENGAFLPTPFIDISEEVGNFGDLGLLAFAIDPGFYNNGYFYLYYTVDRYYLLHYGTSDYDPLSNDYHNATINRLTRYTADAATNFTTVIPGSRVILIGPDKKSGVPVLHQAHQGSSLVFGTDKSLLITTGDGASPSEADNGSQDDTYWVQALADSIITPKENVGAYRAQLVDCYNGKVLRIDPQTGAGLASNPFYDTSNPFSPASRVWCLGFRNPFKSALKPGTGSTNPDDGNPGSLYIGDVGWNGWEELDIATYGGQNCGWPVYEGMDEEQEYAIAPALNLDAPNPLYQVNGCADQYFNFNDLITQATLGVPSFPNPCNSSVMVPSNYYTFVHSRPVIDWSHNFGTQIPTYTGNDASWVYIDDQNSPVQGSDFTGYCAIGGIWYTGHNYPAQYQNTYFIGDFVSEWIKNFTFESTENLLSVSDFHTAPGGIVCMDMDPDDEFIYYVRYPDQIRKIAYLGIVNLAPEAVATSDVNYGVTPLTVNFKGSSSSDPEGGVLTYLWDFGDGQTKTKKNPSHTFTAPAGVPTAFTVTLTVTDDHGLTSSTHLIISLNNTPPNVTITSFANGDSYTVGTNITLPLQASVTDDEQGPGQLFYQWQTILHHNTHTHPQPVDTNKITSTVLAGEGCDGQTYSYQIILTVTDAAGLSTTKDGWLYPNCAAVPPSAYFTATPDIGFVPVEVSFDASLSTNGGDSIVSYHWDFGDGATATGITAAHTYNSTGNYIAALTLTDNYGLTDIYSLTIAVIYPAATSWNSYDAVIHTTASPQATVTDANGYNVTAAIDFYTSSNASGVQLGTPLSVYNPGLHAESFNHVQNCWSLDTGISAYPYAGKSTINRGSDDGEGNNVPEPSGVYDLQLYPPDDANNVVAAFNVPVTGNYSISHLAARRISSLGDKIKYMVFNNSQTLLISIVAQTGQHWKIDTNTYNAGTLNAGDKIYFSVNRNTTNESDATEITWTVNFSPLCTLPSITITANGATTFCTGGSVLLTSSATGTAGTYQWTKGGGNVSGATGNSYSATESGSYACVITNACGTATSNSISVTVNKKPKATVTPSGTVTMCAGNTITLSANTGGSLRYQWKKGSADIAGATNSTYVASTAGKYKVIVTNINTGCTKASSVTTIQITCKSHDLQFALNELQFSVYPNPSSNEFTLQFLNDDAYDVFVFDMLGRKILSLPRVTNGTRFGSELKSGVYLVEVQKGNELTGILKVVKEE